MCAFLIIRVFTCSLTIHIHSAQRMIQYPCYNTFYIFVTQMEIQDLRVQLSHTISREEVEVMRRELQKSEKQRLQLTEHIEVSVPHSYRCVFQRFELSSQTLRFPCISPYTFKPLCLWFPERRDIPFCYRLINLFPSILFKKPGLISP